MLGVSASNAVGVKHLANNFRVGSLAKDVSTGCGQKCCSTTLLLATKSQRYGSCSIPPTNKPSLTNKGWILKHLQTNCAVIAPYSR